MTEGIIGLDFLHEDQAHIDLPNHIPHLINRVISILLWESSHNPSEKETVCVFQRKMSTTMM